VLGRPRLVQRSHAWRPEAAVLEVGPQGHLEAGRLARRLDLARRHCLAPRVAVADHLDPSVAGQALVHPDILATDSDRLVHLVLPSVGP